MKVEFYRILLCPRCLYTGRVLKKIAACQPRIEIEIIEVATNLERIRAAGIRTVPALRIGNDLLTGLILTPQKIRCFIEDHLQNFPSEPPRKRAAESAPDQVTGTAPETLSSK